jgi:hypothetical protein
MIGPDYFRTMKIPFRSGHDSKNQDTPNSQPVVIISDFFARRYWGSADMSPARGAIGAH